MIKIKKHIARVLLGIFFFPIVFQSVHIVGYNHHGKPQDHFLCDIDSDFHGSILTASEKVDHCPICDYEFSINRLPIYSVFDAIVPIGNEIFTATEIKQPHLQIFGSLPPRAPPFQATIS